jgi:hypothetical protein
MRVQSTPSGWTDWKPSVQKYIAVNLSAIQYIAGKKELKIIVIDHNPKGFPFCGFWNCGRIC